jgi:hypothetical protein
MCKISFYVDWLGEPHAVRSEVRTHHPPPIWYEIRKTARNDDPGDPRVLENYKPIEVRVRPGQRDNTPDAYGYICNSELKIPENALDEQLTITFPPNSKGFIRSGHAHFEKIVPAIESDPVRRSVAVDLDYTLEFNPKAQKLDAVIIPDSQYEAWLPEAGRDEQTPGNSLRIHVQLEEKDKPGKLAQQKANFEIGLFNTSREKGVCLNIPAPTEYAKAADGRPLYDMRIDPGANPNLKVEEDGQHANTKEPCRKNSTWSLPAMIGAVTHK